MSDSNDPDDQAPKPDYEVGYGRPPKATQFKPGQSGNPKGRKSKPLSVQAQMQKVLSRKVPITERGKTKSLPLQEVMLRNLANKAAKGDPRTAMLVLKLQSSPEYADTEVIDQTGLSPDDKVMFDAMMEQIMGRDGPGQAPLQGTVEEGRVVTEIRPDQDGNSTTPVASDDEDEADDL